MCLSTHTEHQFMHDWWPNTWEKLPASAPPPSPRALTPVSARGSKKSTRVRRIVQGACRLGRGLPPERGRSARGPGVPESRGVLLPGDSAQGLCQLMTTVLWICTHLYIRQNNNNNQQPTTNNQQPTTNNQQQHTSLASFSPPFFLLPLSSSPHTHHHHHHHHHHPGSIRAHVPAFGSLQPVADSRRLALKLCRSFSSKLSLCLFMWTSFTLQLFGVTAEAQPFTLTLQGTLLSALLNFLCVCTNWPRLRLGCLLLSFA